jgi:hypothetical protein
MSMGSRAAIRFGQPLLAGILMFALALGSIELTRLGGRFASAGWPMR